MAIRNGTTESDQIVGRNTERLFTTDVITMTKMTMRRWNVLGEEREQQGGDHEKTASWRASFGTDNCMRTTRNRANKPKAHGWRYQFEIFALFVLDDLGSRSDRLTRVATIRSRPGTFSRAVFTLSGGVIHGEA